MEKEPSIDMVLAKIKETYNKQASAVDSAVASLEERLRAYKNATKGDLLAGFLEQNGLPAGERKAEVAALALYDAISELPEFKLVTVEVPDAVEVLDAVEASAPSEGAAVAESLLVPKDEEEPWPLAEFAWPLLSKLSPRSPVAIFGGYPLDDKLQWMLDLGVKVDWVSNEAGSRANGTVQRFAAKIRNNTYCGVIALNELMGHHESAAILAACRASGTLYAMGKKAGKGQLRTIFEEFEKRLKQQVEK